MPFLTIPADSDYSAHLDEFSGWKLETIGGTEMVSFYLKKIKGNECTLSRDEVHQLTTAMILLGMSGTPVITELFVHDKDLKVVGQINPIFSPLYGLDCVVIEIQT
jgi:hypothetical protein